MSETEQTIDLNRAIEVVHAVESEVLAEDHTAATREMMVEGTCARIVASLKCNTNAETEDSDE